MFSRANATSFEQVVLPHLDPAYNLARWLVRDPHLAEDVVQDAMVRAMTYFGSFRGDNPRAWLLQIVRNVANGALANRRLKAETPLDAPAVPDGQDAQVFRDAADDPETALSKGQDRKRLDAALAALPPELRECLILREIEELSYKEIARITDVPIGTVMSRLWRARRELMPRPMEGPSHAT